MKKLRFANLSALFLIGLIAFSCKNNVDKLRFNAEKYVIQTITVNGKNIKIRAYENIVYVEKPIDTVYQKLNIYIPEEYFDGKTINGYSVKTAPIFFPNKVGGYMPAKPATVIPNPNDDSPFGFHPQKNKSNEIPKKEVHENALAVALSKGYIVVSAGARGRTTKDVKGTFTGKAPADIVDLKAAVRYLKYNDEKMPGDANKITSNGTSAGGAMSTLLGATGNNKDYEPYLQALGAANATDDIFAVSAYCPIMNLDNADIAYEWQFCGVNTYKKFNPAALDYNVKRIETPDSLSNQQIDVSKKLKAYFPNYVNQLKLKDKNGNFLTLDENGNGNFKELVKSYVLSSAQKALINDFDRSTFSWLTVKERKVIQMDFDAYVKYMERQKTPPAFDALDLSAGENQLFGDFKTDKKHFTDFSAKNSTIEAPKAEFQLIKMMNPMYYVGEQNTTIAKHWRIRHGTKDKDTGLAIPVILATYLENKGFNVNFELAWEKPHSGDYDLNELFEWMDSICK